MTDRNSDRVRKRWGRDEGTEKRRESREKREGGRNWKETEEDGDSS